MQTLCITRIKFILYIYIISMCSNFVLSIVIMEMAVFLLKIRRYACNKWKSLEKIVLCDSNLVILENQYFTEFYNL